MIDLPIVELPRVYLPEETLGSIYFNEKMLCKSMELPWRDNKRGISCFPEGKHLVTKEPPIPVDDPNTEEDESDGRKPRAYWHFRIHNVPGRSGCLIHRISYVSGLKGCIGVGKEFKDLNNDGVPDIIRSGEALQELVDVLPDKFWLHVYKKS